MNALAARTPELGSALEELRRRQNPDGGFGIFSSRDSRPDTTAWALLALRSCGADDDIVEKAARYLQTFQLDDGRVVIAHDEPQVVWPTYVAAWAWQGLPSFTKVQKKATDFILSTSGNWRYIKVPGFGHDPSLRGWAWVENTSSWVDSTSLALLALRASGLISHPRYVEGIKMLLNRELPSGGWNCGNTTVYGTELRPTSESSGIAMALLDKTDKKHAASVEQLRHFIRKQSGPLTLSWTLLSVGEEKDLPVLDEVLAMQQKDSYCQTEWLSLLCMSGSRLSNWKESSILGFPEGKPV